MSLVLLVFNVIGTAVVTTILSHYYGDWSKQNKTITLVHFLSWWLPGLILAVLPIDIASVSGHSVFVIIVRCRHSTATVIKSL